MKKLALTLLAVVGALAFGGAAHAAYPGTYGVQGGPPLGKLHASNAAGDTVLRIGGRQATIHGAFGIPTMIITNTPVGLFRNGSHAVLQSVGIQKTSRFAVVRLADLQVEQTIELDGSWMFDALSPNGQTLYLIHHTSDDFQHYVVRAYDLPAHVLLPQRIADKEQSSWVMQGWPASRAVTKNGRWVYTLYSNPGGFPFVHALDTVNAVAHCVGFAWKGSQDSLGSYRLVVKGNRLLVLRPGGTVYRSIDRTTWAVSLR